ncbi:serine-rich adhesin for platelets isoform X2 [Polyergus mexicanus]|uniref:serine-rich adhesin for platelets isoform X2 n=1 Tax=Polyergus mexicanus TaxID=615972 RepID=UPI0038B49EBE
MWKDKTDRVCRFCKDTFCCTKCRDRHMDKMHPGLNANCCLCASEILPVRHGEFDKLDLRDEELLNHIVEKHLPLRCQLCGDLYESKEDFKSFGKCKWWSQYMLSPISIEQKLKQCFMGDNEVCTPPEIYRKTSTPMLISQKSTFETSYVPYFSLKTPKMNSSSINTPGSQNSDICGVTEFFSFSRISNEDTPFRTDKDEQLPKSNSGRKLNIMEEQDETKNNEAEKITVNEMVDMNLTEPEGGILESPASDIICEKSDRTSDVVKKVRFSDQYETVPEYKGSIKSFVEVILNASTEEEKFHDAREVSSTSNAKNPGDTNNIKDTTKIMQDTENTKDSQMENKKSSYVKLLQNSLIDSQTLQNDTKDTEKENQNPEISDKDSSAPCRQDSSRVLITVLMENNSRGLSTNLIPLIDSGLKKLQEQLASTNQPSSVESTDAVNLPIKSVTRMEMSISNVESYSTKDSTTDCRQIVPSSSLSMQKDVKDNRNNNGFFAAVAQAMKYALKSFSGLGISASNVTTTEVIQQRKIDIEESTSTSLESAVSSVDNIRLRPNKRAREIAEVSSSRVDSIAVDVRSPLAKRQKGWYKMIKARQPINRMRNRYATTSSRGVQVFSQGSLTVGDTILPLPARAHQSTQTE